MSRRFAIVVALAACVAALPLQGQATAAVARYHVTLALLPGDDPAGVAKRLAAMYRGQLETPVDGAGAFTISLSEAQAELLRRDNSVGAVAADESSVVAASRPAAAPANGANLRVATTAVGSPWQSGTYLYDGTGNIKSIGSDVYVYDTNHRLVSADAGSSNAQSYTYDAFGNITGTTTVQAGSTSTIYLGANAATNRMDVTGVNLQTAAYDARGNVTSYQMQQFTYDAVDTVTKAYVDGKWRSYIYSASDERIGTIELSAANGSAIRSDWTVRDTSGKVLRRFSRENDGSWLWNQDYIYRDSQMLAAELPQTAKVYHYHLDHLGTPRLITGNGGVEISRHTYFPFGAEVGVNAGTVASDGERKQFTGHERDRGSLDYMHARYYNPYAGRFLSVDRAPGKPAIPQSWNRYSYAINNPVKYVDPDGNDWTLFIRDSSGGGTTNFGHVALRVHGPGYDYTYDYGRYGATERLLWGEGMLRIWNSWGKFLEGQASHGRGNTLTWQTSKRDDLAMIGHFAALAGAGRQVSSASKYSQFFVQYLLSGEYGRYGILGPNCTTVSMDALSKVASAMALQLEIFAFLNSISPEGLLDDIRTATTPGPRWNFMNENGIIPTDGGTVAVYYNGVQIQ